MKLRVYKNQYGFRTLAKNGEDKMYIQIQFKKGIEPTADTTDIIIKNAFFSMYKNKQGLAFPKLVIMEYEIEGQKTDEQIEREGIMNEQNYSINNDDLPF
jgi:hypothetical protein